MRDPNSLGKKRFFSHNGEPWEKEKPKVLKKKGSHNPENFSTIPLGLGLG